MKNKWLFISSISTTLGLVAGCIYLFFAEHSLLLTEKNWVLSAFWSTFTLWTFLLMFFIALLIHVVAVLNFDNKQHFCFFPTTLFTPIEEKQQCFIHEVECLLKKQGELHFFEREKVEYQYLQADQEKLVYIEPSLHIVDISQIRALFQKMLALDFTAGVVVSYSGFSHQAWIFAQEANIELIDAKTLKKQQRLSRKQNFALA